MRSIRLCARANVQYGRPNGATRKKLSALLEKLNCPGLFQGRHFRWSRPRRCVVLEAGHARCRVSSASQRLWRTTARITALSSQRPRCTSKRSADCAREHGEQRFGMRCPQMKSSVCMKLSRVKRVSARVHTLQSRAAQSEATRFRRSSTTRWYRRSTSLYLAPRNETTS